MSMVSILKELWAYNSNFGLHSRCLAFGHPHAVLSGIYLHLLSLDLLPLLVVRVDKLGWSAHK